MVCPCCPHNRSIFTCLLGCVTCSILNPPARVAELSGPPGYCRSAHFDGCLNDFCLMLTHIVVRVLCVFLCLCCYVALVYWHIGSSYHYVHCHSAFLRCPRNECLSLGHTTCTYSLLHVTHTLLGTVSVAPPPATHCTAPCYWSPTVITHVIMHAGLRAGSHTPSAGHIMHTGPRAV